MACPDATLIQTAPAVALLGDQIHFTGLARSNVYRWYTDPTSRLIYPEEDRAHHGAVFTSQLRRAAALYGPASRAAAVVASLLEQSPEFVEVWSQHEVGLRHTEQKRFDHSEVGRLVLHCQNLLDPDQDQTLLVFTATPGTESHEKLQLLTVIGKQTLRA